MNNVLFAIGQNIAPQIADSGKSGPSSKIYLKFVPAGPDARRKTSRLTPVLQLSEAKKKEIIPCPTAPPWTEFA